MLVVFDPNIFVSALITPKGRARQVVQAGIDGQFEYAICPMLLDELELVSRPTENRQPRARRGRGAAHRRCPWRRSPGGRSGRASCQSDPADDYLVALAVSINADQLVTGDKDLLDLADPPVQITSLREFADALEQPS